MKTPIHIRAMKKIRTPNTLDGCWEWTGCKDAEGYGRILRGGAGSPTRLAHRVVYEMLVGQIPSGMHVLHSCDNPACVNPAHLRLGTHAENMADKTTRGRNSSLPGERNPGAKITEESAKQILECRRRKEPARATADRFGVSQSTVYGIGSGAIWGHLQGVNKRRPRRLAA